MIIVSEPSAETARRVRTDRSISARSPSSAAHNNTPTYTDARPINVHTEEVNRSKIRTVWGLRRALLRDSPALGTKVVGNPEAPVSRRVGAKA
jgi:hypothetical protein